VDAWTEWLDTSDLEIVGTEVPLYYNVGGIAYAGTCDVLAVDKDDNFVICDYKTGKYMYREYPLQMAAYAMALEFCIDVPVTSKVRAFIVKLPKEEGTDPEIREVAHLPEQQDTFIDACKLKLWSSRRDKLLPKRKKSAVRP
jgi:RecB family exonuclease